ncbi:MAG: hypothetical protein FWG43_06140, partial [Clostridiales bacterium]|nr:hypothetical protein [Clostridiales bacterium]
PMSDNGIIVLNISPSISSGILSNASIKLHVGGHLSGLFSAILRQAKPYIPQVCAVFPSSTTEPRFGLHQ